MQALRQVNNAEIMQLKIYMTELSLFRELFTRVKGDWAEFLRQIEEIRSQQSSSDGADPFLLLREKLKETP